MATKTKTPGNVQGRVPEKMMPLYEVVLTRYSQAEIAREGIRSLYRQMTTRQEVTA